MQVVYNYLPQEFKKPNEIIIQWKKLIRSTEFTLGKFMEEFENKFKSFVNSKYCISTNNGTDALILSLKALNIGKGDEEPQDIDIFLFFFKILFFVSIYYM